MKTHFAFASYSFYMTIYAALALGGFAFILVFLLHLIIGLFVWGLFMAMWSAFPAATVGLISGLISSILNCLILFVFFDPIQSSKSIIRLITSTIVLLVSLATAFVIWMQWLTYYSVTGEPNYITLLGLIVLSAISMLIVNNSVLAKLFKLQRKRKEKPKL